MKGDFSRQTFDAKKHYSAVLMQQGRVQVDADWNEQQAINQHHQETEATDVIGKCGVPETKGGFAISLKPHKLYDVIFPKNQTVIGKKGWIVGDRGSIWVTEDSGDRWTEQKSGVVQDLRSVHFLIDKKTGWVVGQNGTILATTDGGKNWTQKVSNTHNDLNDVYFISSSEGWAVGNEGTILATDNAGKDWKLQKVPKQISNTNLNSVNFPTKDKGWVIGDAGTLLVTTKKTNVWTDWEAKTSGVTTNLKSVYFADQNHGWAVGEKDTNKSTILANTKGGDDWKLQTVPNDPGKNLNSVYFVDATKGWAVGDGGTILAATTDTTTGNITWKDVTLTSFNKNLNSVYFVDATKGWAVGIEGNILTYTSTSDNWSDTNQKLEDFEISPGRIYVDGILCENEKPILFSHQLDFPKAVFPTKKKNYLFYLDVWQRHITLLDDPQIHEVALDKADTATRTKTLWQVKAKQIDNPTCSSTLPEWAPSTGKLNARTIPPTTSTDLCKLPPNKGYKRLENQLYRVEIHQGGELGKDKVTFKWSRENGSIVTEIKKIDGQKLTVTDLGKDQVLGFASNQWVEVIDDRLELNGETGYLALITTIDPDTLEITLNRIIPPDAIDMTRHPKLRRWDQADLLESTNVTADGVIITPSTWMSLEDGIEVQFSPGTYKTGDYWLIPARTATAEIQWPPYNPEQEPIPQSPLGIEHHYCCLAIAIFDGTSWNIEDCRPIFSSLKELSEPSLFYVGGDGQEVMPDFNQDLTFPLLPQPLQVRVLRGNHPVDKGAVTVSFTLEEGINGQLSEDLKSWTSTTPVDVKTDENGIAKCYWKLEVDVNNPDQLIKQKVRAELKAGQNFTPIYFSANLSVASQVAYQAKAGCKDLEDTKTVQDAIDKLCGVYQPHKLKVLAFGLAVGIGLALYVLLTCLLGDFLLCIPQERDFDLYVKPVTIIANFFVGFGLGCLVAWCYNIIVFPISEQIK